MIFQVVSRAPARRRRDERKLLHGRMTFAVDLSV